MSFGSKLSAARRQKNLTQEQLAQLLGVTRQAVSRWESDVAYPETEKIVRLAQVLEVSCDALLLEEDGAPQSPARLGPVTRLLREAVGRRVRLTFYESEDTVHHTHCVILEYDGGWANVEFVLGKKKPRRETRLIPLSAIRSITYLEEEG